MNKTLRMKLLLVVLFSALISSKALADSKHTAVGLWKCGDESTDDSRALILFTETAGVLSGKIEKLMVAPGGDLHPTCARCDGKNKNQPLVGLNVVTDMIETEKGSGIYEGGKILVPLTGKIYQSKITVSGDNNTLTARGYIMFSVFGRSKTCARYFQ
jgi:uncharacterized protein (DUF2147 family)